ncbi:exosomal polycystin-1-interacting protein [Microcaecilia unicolor]|uniref:Uncharacterized protein C21orf62 homolog n=1 Tax=Microcaecilia unicolor TaxID=1415580 RepID=A0A6P7Y0P1_9AMPH|nr:uncharacterized protein C21orf62 homolog [Microcaecilia unicolor]
MFPDPGEVLLLWQPPQRALPPPVPLKKLRQGSNPGFVGLERRLSAPPGCHGNGTGPRPSARRKQVREPPSSPPSAHGTSSLYQQEVSIAPDGALCTRKPRRRKVSISVAWRPVRKMLRPISKYHLLTTSLVVFWSVQGFVTGQKNSTLIFTKDNNIRNCSCASDIRDCDYSLANLICSCKTVLQQTISRATPGPSYSSDLTLWFSDTAALSLLLNFTSVHNLKLSLCGTAPLPSEYLAVLGLRRLRIHSSAAINAPDQSLIIHNMSNRITKDGSDMEPSKSKNLFYISYLDTALFNGYSSLKSYSVVNVSSISDHFPNLPYCNTITDAPDQTYIVTLIY